jgi:hypothetical protein
LLIWGNLSTLLYARRMRWRLVEGLRFGTPINIQIQSFNLSSSVHADGGSFASSILLAPLFFFNPAQFDRHNGCCGNSSSISSRT